MTGKSENEKLTRKYNLNMLISVEVENHEGDEQLSDKEFRELILDESDLEDNVRDAVGLSLSEFFRTTRIERFELE